jgi:hypothetical protein
MLCPGAARFTNTISINQYYGIFTGIISFFANTCSLRVKAV